MDKRQIQIALYLNEKRRESNPVNIFNEDVEQALWKAFCFHYSKIIESRGSKIIVSAKENTVLRHIFWWCISSPAFNGDLKKGLYLVSKQGFGKDVILKTIVEFFKTFGKTINEYSFNEFNKRWFEGQPHYFNSPIKINDLTADGRMKRERTSIPIVEFLDHREISNNRRSIIVSSNYLPEGLQKALEFDSNNPRFEERCKECFNVVHIKGAESKRVSNIITL